jgi:hypothetical protein
MRRFAKYIPLPILLLCVGCLVSGDVVVVVELDDAHLQTSDDSRTWFVSKDSVSDWSDHFEDINHIVDVGFSMTITNNNQTDNATGDFYISKTLLTGTDNITSEGTKILSGITVPAGTSKHITWQESYTYLSNFSVLKQYVMDGEMYVYAVGIGENLDVDLTKIAVILTVNAKP